MKEDYEYMLLLTVIEIFLSLPFVKPLMTENLIVERLVRSTSNDTQSENDLEH